MKLKGKEKFFWERNFNIKHLDAIPIEMEGITGIDSDHEDEFFHYLVSRVKAVHRIYLRCTFVTDEGVKSICKLRDVRELTLKDHRRITRNCLPDIDKLADLEYLDLSKSAITPPDLLQLHNLKRLKELLISSDSTGIELEEEVQRLRAHFPGCEVTIY